MKPAILKLRAVITAAALLLSLAAVAFAQTDVSGKYEGTVKTPGAADASATLELKNDGGKISGRFVSGATTLDISEGTLTDGRLSLRFGAAGKDGVLTATVDAEKITGDWIAGAQKKSVELKKAGTAAATASAAPKVDLNGQWDAVADAQGQPFPFLLTLKVEGEKVTGSSSSQLGDNTIKNGTWKDGKLTMEFEGQTGSISMTAEVVDGKLAGQFDFSGQLSGKWTAVKKN